MKFKVAGAPHFPPTATVAGVMRKVLYALVPGVLAHVWFFGPGVLFQIVLSIGFALGFEALMLKARGRPIRPFLSDYSAVVTAVLFALCLPSLAPWWIAFVGMLFAIVIAKHLYGGLGYNLFNPAMVGFAGLLLSFHPGLRSIGELAVVGIGATLLGALVFLPALLRFLEARNQTTPETAPVSD